MSIELKSVLIGLLLSITTIVCGLISMENASAMEFECVKIKYSTVIDRYGIYTGDQRGFDFFLGDRKSIPLGSCFDNNSTINLYRTEAQEIASKEQQDYLNDYIPKELSELELAIILLESMNYSVTNNNE